MSTAEETQRILSLVEHWTEDPAEALRWFTEQRLDVYEGRTAQQLVQQGHSEAVLALLNDAAFGTFV